MARAETPTLLPLDTWAKIMGINPWEFNQIGDGFPTPNLAQCEYVWFQYPWQQDFLSRSELAETISRAEQAVARHLGFYPCPAFTVNEPHPYPRPYNRELYGAAGTPRGQWKAVQLNWGKIQGAGILARSVVNPGGVVTLFDTDGDGVDDKFTVTVATTLTDPEEIAIYFSTADRNNAVLDETWRIRPVNVVFSGGNVVISGHPSMLVKPDLTTVTDPDILDVTVAANLVTTVEVYRVYLDTTSDTTDPNQGSALWENSDCALPPCTAEWLPVCVAERDAEMGLVSVDYSQGGTYCPPQNREPDRVVVNYLSGEPLVNGQMQADLARIIAYLATAWLPVGKCGCDRSNRIIDYYRSIEVVDTQGAVPLTESQLNNPFGPQRGAIYAWNRIEELRIIWAALA